MFYLYVKLLTNFSSTFNSLDLSNTIDNIPVLDTGCIPIDFSPVYLDLFTMYTLFTKK